MTGRFAGRTVFVTGGAHGIGLATASAFAEEGASLFLLDRDPALLPSAAASVERSGTSVITHLGDVRERADVEAAVRECVRSLGRIDVLVNNAGFGRSRHTVDVSATHWDDVVDVNLTGAFRVAQTVGRWMAQNGGGVILNTCSTSAIASEPGLVSYAAAKAGLLALTRVMSQELRIHRIRACAVLPGEVATYPFPSVELHRIYQSRIAIGRSGRADEIAPAFLYLASDEARDVTGAALTVDGGMLAWE